MPVQRSIIATLLSVRVCSSACEGHRCWHSILYKCCVLCGGCMGSCCIEHRRCRIDFSLNLNISQQRWSAYASFFVPERPHGHACPACSLVLHAYINLNRVSAPTTHSTASRTFFVVFRRTGGRTCGDTRCAQNADEAVMWHIVSC